MSLRFRLLKANFYRLLSNQKCSIRLRTYLPFPKSSIFLTFQRYNAPFDCVICHTESFFADHQLKISVSSLCCVIWKINPIWYSAFSTFISLHKCFHSFIVSCRMTITSSSRFSISANTVIVVSLFHSIRFIYKQNASSCRQKCFSDSTYAIPFHPDPFLHADKCTTF